MHEAWSATGATYYDFAKEKDKRIVDILVTSPSVINHVLNHRVIERIKIKLETVSNLVDLHNH